MTKHLTVMFLALAVSAPADTLTLRMGTSAYGNWLGIDGGKIKFQTNGEVREFRQSDVASVSFATDTPAQIRVDAPLPPDSPPPPPDTPLTPDTPPPPVSAPTEINLKPGSTVADVTAKLGQPTRITTFGSKQIYQFKDLKVTFVDGKMTDTQ